MKFCYILIITQQVLIAYLLLGLSAEAGLTDFTIEQKSDGGGDSFFRHTREKIAPQATSFSSAETAGEDQEDPCLLLSEEEAPPMARDIFDLENPDEDLTATGIDIRLPDGTTISRLEHRVGHTPVWNSGATVAQPPPIRGLCAGPAKLTAASGPIRLNRIARSLDGAQYVAPTWVSVQTCMQHWRVEPRDQVYENNTRAYFYQSPDGFQTDAHEVDIRGLDYAKNAPFRIFCLIDARRNETIKSWDGLQTYYGYGGNVKTSKYRYGADDPMRPLLPAIAGNGQNCLMQNPDRTVIVYDMKSSSSRIIPGRTTIVSYSCATGPDDSINSAYGPLADCFFNTNKTVQFLLDPDWGFSTDIKKYTPVGLFHVGAHFNQKYDNAFWDGSAFYVGDGGSTFLPLCTCEDVVAHEIGHSLTQMTSDLIYSEESGCMNEAFSDMMAESLEFYYRGKADFKIGSSCMKTRPFLRDMSVPMSYNKFMPGTDPHLCSGIFNHAFYRLANAPGWGVKHAWKVFLNANVGFWKKNTGMKQAACDVAVSASRYRIGGDRQYVINAFRAVDIDVSSCMPITPTPSQPSTTIATTTTLRPLPTIKTVVPPSQTTRPAPTITTRATTTTTMASSGWTWPSWLTWLIPRRVVPTTTPVYTRATFGQTTPPPQFTPPASLPSSGASLVTVDNCEDVNELSANTGEALYFKILVPDDATKMNIFIDGLNGDADLYVRQGALPTLASYDQRPYWKGSIEWVRTNIKSTGWYYIMIYATKNFEDLSLDACFI